MVIDTGVSVTLDVLWWINALDGACPYHPPSIAQEKALLLLPVCYFWHLVNRPSTEHLFLQSPQGTEADVAVDEATANIRILGRALWYKPRGQGEKTYDSLVDFDIARPGMEEPLIPFHPTPQPHCAVNGVTCANTNQEQSGLQCRYCCRC